jgi:hypothetical protein
MCQWHTVSVIRGHHMYSGYLTKSARSTTAQRHTRACTLLPGRTLASHPAVSRSALHNLLLSIRDQHRSNCSLRALSTCARSNLVACGPAHHVYLVPDVDSVPQVSQRRAEHNSLADGVYASPEVVAVRFHHRRQAKTVNPFLQP